MTPLPKRKYAKARQGKRQSHLNQALPSLSECPQCHSAKMPHRVCPVCGYYKGREAITIKAPKKK